MVQAYASFLVRCWVLVEGEQRIRIEHIQSLEWTQVTTFDEALAWMQAHRSDSPDVNLDEPFSGSPVRDR